MNEHHQRAVADAIAQRWWFHDFVSRGSRPTTSISNSAAEASSRLVSDRPQQAIPEVRMRAADDDPRDFLFAGEIHQRLDHVGSLEPDHFGAKVGGQIDVVEQGAKIRRADFLHRFVRGLDVHGVPVGIDLGGGARGLAQDFVAAVGIGGHADHQALGDGGAASALALEQLELLALAALIARDFAQRQFAQRRRDCSA